MIYIGNGGPLMFEDPFEMTYELLNEMELELKPDGSIYSPILHGLFYFNGLLIKASTDPHNIHYAGQGEIVLDLFNNVRIATMMFGHMLQKRQAEGMSFLSWSPFELEIEDEEPEPFKVSSIVVKYDFGKEQETMRYRNKCLKFVHAIFMIGGTDVDLSNLDTVVDITR